MAGIGHYPAAVAPRYFCHDCSRPYSSKFSLRKHRESVHEKVRPFGCHRCDYRAAQGVNMQRHLRSKHGVTLTLKDIFPDMETVEKRCGKTRRRNEEEIEGGGQYKVVVDVNKESLLFVSNDDDDDGFGGTTEEEEIIGGGEEDLMVTLDQVIAEHDHTYPFQEVVRFSLDDVSNGSSSNDSEVMEDGRSEVMEDGFCQDLVTTLGGGESLRRSQDEDGTTMMMTTEFGEDQSNNLFNSCSCSFMHELGYREYECFFCGFGGLTSSSGNNEDAAINYL